MNESDLKRLLRRIVLGVSATPLLWLPACGRSELPLEFPPDASVIPSRDAGFDAGTRFDAGLDAGPGDGGWTIIRTSCAQFGGWADTSMGRFYKDGGVMLDAGLCESICGVDDIGTPITECTPVNAWELVCWSNFCAIGRLADGIGTHAEGPSLGRHFADMAAHEAAAVVAFEQLARELARHELPEQLVRGAKQAAREERRHTRLAGALAHRHGGTFGLTRDRPTELRSLEALALDNAVEGCARETFGAMVGLYQSRHAPDPQVRAVMASVSEDELGHGAWSWAMADELSRRLPLPARRRIRETRDTALTRLSSGLLDAFTPSERVALGLPDQARLETMAQRLRDALS
ncbi:MAG: ferritin-like domain-containing protein [Archangium sp.]|nr:ferritin-like domain-containing protein [Archangium sp.]